MTRWRRYWFADGGRIAVAVVRIAIASAVLIALWRISRGTSLEAGDLGLRASATGAPSLEQMTLDEVERVLIQKALARHGGNVSDAAKTLGLSRSALYRRLERHGL